MHPLDRDLRRHLESTVKAARDIAERAARSLLEQLGVERAAAFSYLSERQRGLRRRLRSHGRQLGDRFLPTRGSSKVMRPDEAKTPDSGPGACGTMLF
ncbi:MAG: hypothetical protein KGS73_13560 [Chloroflexi bacterium]|nr:hypothetical protein [Chloroflexota bacterium]